MELNCVCVCGGEGGRGGGVSSAFSNMQQHTILVIFLILFTSYVTIYFSEAGA